MNAYIIAHAPFFLPAQIAGLARAYDDCDVTIVAARGSGGRLEKFGRVLQSPTHGILPILDWLFDHASDGPAIFLEYDVVPVAPLHGNWMNQRGIQERGQAFSMGGLWPAAFGWESRSNFRREFFRTLKDPFAGEWQQVVQDRAVVHGGLPECAENSDIRVIGGRLLHYVNGTGRMRPDRSECFSLCLQQYGIEWQGPATSSQTARKSSPGLGDLVKSGLSAVGITEERVSKAIGKPCGCGKRAEAMNKFGAKYLGMPPGRVGNLEPDA